jgi:catechol 2,3-dioxygenase-like lactoylglutathione lyase family enzyme
MPLTIRELNHVLIRVRDLDAAIHFYGEILGLRRLPRPDFDFPGAWFALGQQELHLAAHAQVPPPPRTHHHFALWVEDPTAARAELEKKGWKDLRGPQRRPDGVMQLFVTDPEGYVIELMSAPPPRPGNPSP